MSKNPGTTPGIELTALKKNQSIAIDLMRPGNGTPWEDRGSIGSIRAYFQTAFKSLTSPALLMDHIRRPETTSDGFAFALISSAMWTIGVLLWNVFWLYYIFPRHSVGPDRTFDPYVDSFHYWLSAGLQAVIVGGGFYLWVRLAPKMYVSLAGSELKGSTPSLAYNCFSYALGPSILAVVPIIGWLVALPWIFFDLVVAGKRRLYMKNSSAFINPLLVLFCALGIAVVAYFAVRFVWNNLLDMTGLTPFQPPPPKETLIPSVSPP